MPVPIRIANISGFFGDRQSAAREMIDDGDVDVLTGDWLAELTMLILARMRDRRPGGGFAATFVRQMQDVMEDVLARGIKVVSNAGGLDPVGCATALQAVAEELGISPRIAVVGGDDLMHHMASLIESGHRFEHMHSGAPLGSRLDRLVVANAYLGGWGIADALGGGADIVVTGRVTDAALVVGPSAWHHGWQRTDWDQLAGAVVAGHVIECGTQATGGNYSFFEELADPMHLGFPWAEVAEDGSSVIGKHDGTGGEVSAGTVLSQLLYEIGSPRYFNPDVTSRFDTISVDDLGGDRVSLSGIKGEPPPATLKVSMAYAGGYRNALMIGLTGGDIEAKADLVIRQFWDACQWDPEDYDAVETQIVGRPAVGSNASATCYVRIAVRDEDARKVGRAWSNAATSIALGSVPGYFGAAPPGPESEFAVMWPTTIDRSLVAHEVTVDEKTHAVEEPSTHGVVDAPTPQPTATWPGGETTTAPLGTVVGARSGDKAGNANLGLFVRDLDHYPWLATYLTAHRLAELVPEIAGLTVARHVFPNLGAINFEIIGLLDEGVSSSLRPDPQAKGFGEYVRSIEVPIPTEFLGERRLDDAPAGG